MSRKKPKKCDFIYKGVRYWIEDSEVVDYTNSTSHKCADVFYVVLQYEDDQEPPDELFEDEEFWEKILKNGYRLMPPENVLLDYYIERC